MYEINGTAADALVRAADARIKEIDRTVRTLRGPDFAPDRKRLRAEADGLHRAIAGLNTGEGVTRREAASERRQRPVTIDGFRVDTGFGPEGTMVVGLHAGDAKLAGNMPTDRALDLAHTIIRKATS